MLHCVALDTDRLEFFIGLLSLSGREDLILFVHNAYDKQEGAESTVVKLEQSDRSDAESLAKLVDEALNDTRCSVNEDAVIHCLHGLISNGEQAIADTSEHHALTERMRQLKALFDLDDDEVEILFLTLCYRQLKELESECDDFPFPEKLELVAILTGMPLSKVAKCSGRRGKLVRCGIIEPLSVTHRFTFYTLCPEVSDYLMGLDCKSLLEMSYRRVTQAEHSVEGFCLPQRSTEIVMSLMRSNSPCNIVLYGEPGTGKTEFAKAIALECGKDACFLTQGEEGDNKFRCLALEASLSAVSPATGIVVVDEADALLNTRYAFLGGGSRGTLQKGWLNDFLDRSRAQIVWIVNDITCIEESTRRRFAYSIEFKHCNARRREQIWREQLKDHPFGAQIDDALIGQLAREYQVNAGGISSALAAIGQVVSVECADAAEIRDCLGELLGSHERFIGRRRHGKLSGAAAQYDPDAVNTDVHMPLVVENLKSCLDLPRDRRLAVNLLFWGMAGTGKTAFAQYLARELGKELILRRASDLLSKYVGGTEQRIQRAFELAEHEDAILFLDEADSFFINRENAQRSWEASQTNELLTQMENHKGILICCTNLVDHLDHAAMRRFAWKIKFLPLTVEGKLRLYRKLFNLLGRRLTPVLQTRLRTLADLTPGDMEAVRRRYHVTNHGSLNHRVIIDALEQELSYRQGSGSTIGF